jgi:hypothetical protein
MRKRSSLRAGGKTKTRSRLATLLCIFFLASCTNRRSTIPQREKASEEAQQNDQKSASQQNEINFKEILEGERITRDGQRFPFHSWRSSDGITVTSSTQEFSTAARAHSAYSGRVRDASRVIRTGPRTSEDEHIVGERSVVTFVAQGSGREVYGVLWTDGSTLHDVESISLRHALAFEGKFYPPPQPPSPR